MNFISSLAKEAGTSTIDLYRKIRKKQEVKKKNVNACTNLKTSFR